MSFPPPWNDGTAVPDRGGPQAPPPYQGPNGLGRPPVPPPYQPQQGPQQHDMYAGGPAEQAPYRLAQWWQRALARAIDGLIVGIPIVIVALIVSLAWAGAQSLSGYGDAVERNSNIVYGVIAFILLVVYETICLTRRRRTLGKVLMNLQVAPLNGGGLPGPIPVASIAARAALFNLPLLTFWSMGGGMIAMILLFLPCSLLPLWDKPNRQGLHDKLAGTVVVRTD